MSVTILDIDKDLPKVIRLVIEYLSKQDVKYSVSEIADYMSLSVSYIYKLRSDNVKLSVDTRRSFLLSLLNMFEVSVVKNDVGEFEMTEIVDPLFSNYRYKLCIYDKDSKILEERIALFGMISSVVSIETVSGYHTGEYNRVAEVTRVEAKNYSNYQGYKTPDNIEIILTNEIPLKKRSNSFRVFYEKVWYTKNGHGTCYLIGKHK